MIHELLSRIFLECGRTWLGCTAKDILPVHTNTYIQTDRHFIIIYIIYIIYIYIYHHHHHHRHQLLIWPLIDLIIWIAPLLETCGIAREVSDVRKRRRIFWREVNTVLERSRYNNRNKWINWSTQRVAQIHLCILYLCICIFVFVFISVYFLYNVFGNEQKLLKGLSHLSKTSQFDFWLISFSNIFDIDLSL